MSRIKNIERRKIFDFRIFLVVVLLLIFGVIFLSSASSDTSYQDYGNSAYMFFKQIAFISVGIVVMYMLYKIDVRKWKKVSFLVFAATVVAMLAVFVPVIGVESGGATRWVDLGLFQFQPSELFKFAVIIYLASLFEKKGSEIRDFGGGFVPFVAIISLISLLLYMQSDLGTLFIILSIAGIMFFISGAKYRHIGIILLSGFLLLSLLIATEPYRLERFKTFIGVSSETSVEGDNSSHVINSGYQSNQGLIAIGSGGLFGRGLGNSIQKYKYLPEPSTDSIFAIIAEEGGFVGSVFLVILYTIFGFFGFDIARKTSDSYNRLLAVGITSWVLIQAFLNIAAIIGLVPLTGLPLPFISYGGTSMVVLLAATGILLNISKNIRKREGGI